MSNCQQQLWHCINTKKVTTVVDFYNNLGLDLKPLNIWNRRLYVSNVAPFCILENDSEKNAFIWTEKICPEFKEAFNGIRQTICQDLAQVKMENVRNFNR